jgi:flagellar protein FliS
VPLNARAAYRDTALTTAPPGRLLTMLYDRLIRDLYDAAVAIPTGNHMKVNETLKHAQEIVIALSRALNVEVWPAGKGLAQIYDFLLRHMVAANLSKSVDKVHECLSLVEPLALAWHQAYQSAGVTVRAGV